MNLTNRLSPAPSPHRNGKAAGVNPVEPQRQQGFTLSSVSRASPRIELSLATLFLALGTTASEVIDRCRRNAVPAGVGPDGSGPLGFLGIDAAMPDGIPPAHFLKIGVDGVGTDPAEGRRLFQAEEPRIFQAVLNQVSTLFDVHPLISAQTPPQRSIRIVIIAGPGGTSGGLAIPMIDLAFRAALRRGVESVRIDVVLIGPEIVLNAADRRVQGYQRERIRATFAQNLQSVYESIARDTRAEPTSGAEGTVHSLVIADRQNDRHCLGTMAEFITMLGDALFSRFCTRAGVHVDQRICDQRGCGQHRGQAH